jgi:predicted nicotinamide N-methyase
VHTHSGASHAVTTHSALQRRLLRNAASPAGAPGSGAAQPDALRLRPVPLAPEIRLFLAEDPMLLWARLEADAGVRLAAPFWATAWTGGQAVARYVLDNPDRVAGRRVLDLASGSGLAAIAAAKAGAARVTANDIDGHAIAAIEANADANGARIVCDLGDRTGGDGGDAEVILAGDCLYSAELAARVLPFVIRAGARGATVLLGDPGRGFTPSNLLETLATYHLPAMGAAEDGQHERASVLVPVGSALARQAPGRRPRRRRPGVQG